jgi:hypothetical protein
MYPLRIALACLFSLAVHAQDFGDQSSSTLAGKAWAASGGGTPADALAYTAKCKELYEAIALKQQAALTDFAPADKAHDNWALNDVGTCYFIEAQVYEKLGKKPEAIAAYKKLATDLAYAQCWDTKGWFWRPASAAKDRLKQLEFDAALDD